MRQLIYLAIVLCFTVQHISADCCPFISDDCLYTIGPWQWSGAYPLPSPPVSFTTHDTYLWTNAQTGSALTASPRFTISSAATYISFDYYYSNSNFASSSYLHIYFVPDTFPSYHFLLLETPVPTNAWISERVPCNYGTTYCCGVPGTACNGHIEIFADIDLPYVDAIFGIDSIGTCSTPVSCCTITNTDSCGYDNSVLNEYYWQNSLTYPPVNQPPVTASGVYVYSETIDNKELNALDIDFVSTEIAIPAAIDFQAYVYVESTNAINGLQIRFRESSSGFITDLVFIPTTYGGWLDISFHCGDTGHDCCVSQSSCSGELILTAHVEGLGENVFCAVNRIGQSPC